MSEENRKMKIVRDKGEPSKFFFQVMGYAVVDRTQFKLDRKKARRR